jgi:hypothetical protein
LLVPEVDAATHRKFDTRLPWQLNAYSFVQFLSVIPIALFVLAENANIGTYPTLAGVSYVLLALTSIAAVLDNKRVGFVLELARLGATGIALGVLWARMPLAVTLGVGAFLAVSIVWLSVFGKLLGRSLGENPNVLPNSAGAV